MKKQTRHSSCVQRRWRRPVPCSSGVGTLKRMRRLLGKNRLPAGWKEGRSGSSGCDVPDMKTALHWDLVPRASKFCKVNISRHAGGRNRRDYRQSLFFTHHTYNPHVPSLPCPSAHSASGMQCCLCGYSHYSQTDYMEHRGDPLALRRPQIQCMQH